MVGAFGAMTSLTGGGGLRASEDLGSDTINVGGLNTTGMTFAAKPDNTPLYIVGGLLLALALLGSKGRK